MEIQNKPTYNKIAIVIWQFFFAGVLLVFGASLIWSGVSEAMRYRTVQQRAVRIMAEGYSVSYVDDDGDTDYRLNVKYQYAGETYIGEYRVYEKESEAEALVGQQIEIFIDPSKPMEQLSYIAKAARQKSMPGVMVFSLGISVAFVRKRKRYTETYGWYAEYIEKDIREKYMEDAAPWVSFYVAGLCYLMCTLVFSDVMGNFGLLTIGAFVLGTLRLIPWLMSGSRIRHGRYRIARQTLIDKKIESDGDATAYNLYYSEGAHVWSRSVSKKYYNAARFGETVDAVFLEGAKKPFLVCDNRE